MFDEMQPAEVLLKQHLQDAINQQDFFKKHLVALKNALDAASGEGGLSDVNLEESHKHLVALSQNQQHILDDVIAIQKAFLTRKEYSDSTELAEITTHSIGAIRRAHEPMFQLVRDNQAMISKLILMWKNLCSFLGIKTQQGFNDNLDALEFQLGMDEIRFELQAFFWLLKKLAHQRDLIEKKLKVLSVVFKSDKSITPELICEIETLFEAYHLKCLDEPFPELSEEAVSQVPEAVPTMEPHHKSLSLTMPYELSEGEHFGKWGEVKLRHEAAPQNDPACEAQPALRHEQAYNDKLGVHHLSDELRATLEARLGLEATNYFANQIMALHLQVHRLSWEQHKLINTLGDVELLLKPSPEPKLQPNLELKEGLSKLEQEALARRTMFYRPRLKY